MERVAEVVRKTDYPLPNEHGGTLSGLAAAVSNDAAMTEFDSGSSSESERSSAESIPNERDSAESTVPTSNDEEVAKRESEVDESEEEKPKETP
jgi:hypothetical protein